MTASPIEIDPIEQARLATESFSSLPGQLGCIFDHSGQDLVVGHIDVTEDLIAGTGFLFAPAVMALADTFAAIGTLDGVLPVHPDDLGTAMTVRHARNATIAPVEAASSDRPG
jgi:acyl-coenzyme A thioesterase PaaI-like protein